MERLRPPLLSLALACWLPVLARAAIPVGDRADGRVAGRMPLFPSSFGAAVSEGWVYAFGGHLGAEHDYAKEHQSPFLLRASVGSLSSWELMSVDELGVQGPAAVAFEGRLVRIGGMRARNAAGQPMELMSIDDVAAFDPSVAVWSALPHLPKPRSSHAAAVCGNLLYVAGGWTLDDGSVDRGGEFAHEALVLDLATPGSGWRTLPSPGLRRGLALVATGGRLVAIGGMDDSGKATSRVDVFDPESGAWTSAAQFPDYGFGVAACSVGDAVYASGRAGRLCRWLPGSSAWEDVGSLVYPRIFHQLVADEARSGLIVLGGARSGQRVAAVERIALKPEHAGARISRLTLPAPCAAKNRSAMVLDGDRVEFFGGNTGLEQHGFEPARFTSESWTLGLCNFSWRRLPDLPVHRQSIVTASLEGGRALLAGGFGPGEDKARSYPETFVWSRELEQWHAATPLPQPRTQFALHEHAQRLWLLGGLDYDAGRGGDEAFRYPLEVLSAPMDASARFEPTGLQLPRPRRAFGSAQLGARCYLVGGLGHGFSPIEICDVLDLDTRSWSTIPPPRRPRLSPELVELGGRLYLAGGSSQGESGELGPDRSIEVFDPAAQSWSVCVEELPLDTTHARLFAWHGQLLLISTHVERADALELVWIDPRAAPPTR